MTQGEVKCAEQLHRFHGQYRSRVTPADPRVRAGRIIATLLDSGPDVDHGIGHEHRRFNDQLPVTVSVGPAISSTLPPTRFWSWVGIPRPRDRALRKLPMTSNQTSNIRTARPAVSPYLSS